VAPKKVLLLVQVWESREFVYPVIRWRVSLIRLEVGIGQMKGYELFSWFSVWITWFRSIHV